MSEKRLPPFNARMIAFWIVLINASVGIASQNPPQADQGRLCISLAKLVAGGRMTGGGVPNGPTYQEYLADFYGTIIETIESAEMHRRALDRVRALHPNLEETKVEIQVTRNEGSAIFNVRASGREPQFTRIFLDALLDEFIAFRNQIREQQRNKALTALAENVVRREKDLGEKQDKLVSFRKANHVVLLTEQSSNQSMKLREMLKRKDELESVIAELSQANDKAGDLARILSRDSTAVTPAAKTPPPGSIIITALADRLLSGEAVNMGQEYLNTQRALRLLEAGRDQAPEESSDSLKRKAAQATTALKVIEGEVLQQANEIKTANENALKALNDQIDTAKQQALELGAIIATHEQLTKELDEKKKAYDQVLDLVRRFTTSEDMTTDHVTIMERASFAMEETRK